MSLNVTSYIHVSSYVANQLKSNKWWLKVHIPNLSGRWYTCYELAILRLRLLLESWASKIFLAIFMQDSSTHNLPFSPTFSRISTIQIFIVIFGFSMKNTCIWVQIIVMMVHFLRWIVKFWGKRFTFQFLSACRVLDFLVSLPLLQASMAPMNVSDDYKEWSLTSWAILFLGLVCLEVDL